MNRESWKLDSRIHKPRAYDVMTGHPWNLGLKMAGLQYFVPLANFRIDVTAVGFWCYRYQKSPTWLMLADSEDLVEYADRGDLEAVKDFLARRPTINIKNDEIVLPALHIACIRGHLEITKCLIEAGANINYETALGKKLLLCASRGHLTIVKYLIQKGCNVDYEDEIGFCALDWATIGGHFEVFKLLIENSSKGKDAVNYMKSFRDIPLYRAAQLGNLEWVEFLMRDEVGADPKMKNGFAGNGETAAEVAASHGHLLVLQHIIEEGFSEEGERDVECQRCLIRAACADRGNIVYWLLSKGIRRPITDCKNTEAFEAALERSRLDALSAFTLFEWQWKASHGTKDSTENLGDLIPPELELLLGSMWEYYSDNTISNFGSGSEWCNLAVNSKLWLLALLRQKAEVSREPKRGVEELLQLIEDNFLDQEDVENFLRFREPSCTCDALHTDVETTFVSLVVSSLCTVIDLVNFTLVVPILRLRIFGGHPKASRENRRGHDKSAILLLPWRAWHSWSVRSASIPYLGRVF